MQLEILKNTGFCLAFHSGFWIGTQATKGTRRCMWQKPPKDKLCLTPPVTTMSVLLLTRHLPCLS